MAFNISIQFVTRSLARVMSPKMEKVNREAQRHEFHITKKLTYTKWHDFCILSPCMSAYVQIHILYTFTIMVGYLGKYRGEKQNQL